MQPDRNAFDDQCVVALESVHYEQLAVSGRHQSAWIPIDGAGVGSQAPRKKRIERRVLVDG
jgi:hypothetical protein